MKKAMLLFLLTLCLADKAAAEEANALTLWMASGKKVVCLLDKQPVVTFKDEEIVLTTRMNVVRYPSAEVVKFTYSYVDPAGITMPDVAEAGFVFDGNYIRAFNLEPRSWIEVYSVDGRRLSKSIADGRGCAVVSVIAGSGNTYVIKTSVADFKIMKP